MDLRVVLVAFLLGVCVEGQRWQRQDWNFPNTNTETRPMRPPPRNPQAAGGNRPAADEVPAGGAQPGVPTGVPNPAGELTISSLGVVFQVPCPCPAPPQYSPVCGSDGNTYVNNQMLKCATSCGFNVTMTRLGVCSSPR